MRISLRSLPGSRRFSSLPPGPVNAWKLASALCLALATNALALEPCRIEIVEKGSGWPVPLVELRTTHDERLVSDNAGVIACDLPEAMDHETWFSVLGHGYTVPKDGFGMRGVRLTPRPGKTLRVEVERQNIARRLGRLTGGGLFAESQKLGQDLDWQEQGIFGCDSVLLAPFSGKLFWAWGDTTMPNYGLGIYSTTSATTPAQPLTRFEPPLRLRFDYFADGQGRPRGVAPLPGDGPTWLSAYLTLPDAQGTEHLVATYMKIRNHLDAYEAGLGVWNSELAKFDRLRVVWQRSAESPKLPPLPDGHPARWKDEQGQDWVFFGNPFPRLRCPATFEAWQDPSRWEVLTPQPSVLSPEGQKIEPHTGSIAWSEYRQCWVTVFMQKFGKPSGFGELWYAEAPAPTGPWGCAVKVLTHENYTFYNPRLHAELTPAGSPILLFEGTYTSEFADHPQITPRYNYNQMLYRLDLDDPKLAPTH